MASSKLRIGVLGAANIARAFCAGVAPSETVVAAAIASRTPEKAKAFAEEVGVTRWHGSYEAMLADPDIEAVYIPLPNSLHGEWAIRAAEAGKHVLCEKPLAMTGAEARAMFAAADRHGVALREAYPYLASHQTAMLRAWLAEKAIGRLTLIRSTFGVYFDKPDNIRMSPTLGGGALLDAGSYSVSFARIAAGEQPVRVQAAATRFPNGVDRTTTATLEFASGLTAQVAASFETAYHRHGLIAGETGVIETNYLNHPPIGGPTLLRIRRGTPVTTPAEDARVPDNNGFRAEAESFARLVRGDAAGWTGATPAESIDVALILDAIARAAVAGGEEPVER